MEEKKARIHRFEELKGETITHILGAEKDSDEILFILSNNRRVKLYHPQECCEHVSIEDICGDVTDLLDTPLLVAEEIDNHDEFKKNGSTENLNRSGTWTFYKLATIKGSVDIRWYGESNGYYSETAHVQEFDENGNYLY